MKTYFALAFLLVFSSSSVIGQEFLDHQVPQYKDVNSFRGSRFLYDEFMVGTIYHDGLTTPTTLPVRLNLYHDQFEYLKNDSTYAFATPSRVDSIRIGGEVFTHLDGNNDLNLSGFVKIWGSKLPTIVTKMIMEISPSLIAREGDFDYAIPPRFERKNDQHYLMRSETDILEIKSVRHLIYLLTYQSPELEKFAREEKISSSNGAELAWLLEHHLAIEEAQRRQ